MSLYFWRPKLFHRSNKALFVSNKKRRRPLDMKFSLKNEKHFIKHVEIKQETQNDEQIITARTSTPTSSPIPKSVDQVDSKISLSLDIKADLDDNCSTSSTATLTGNSNNNEQEKSQSKEQTKEKHKNDEENSTKTENEEEKSQPTEAAEQKNIEHKSVNKENDVKTEIVDEKMNTSDCEDENAANAMDITLCADDAETSLKTIELKDAKELKESNKEISLDDKVDGDLKKGEDKRLKKQKQRAKLSTIVEQLIAKQPLNSKSTLITAGSGTGVAANSSNHSSKSSNGNAASNNINSSGIHKVSELANLNSFNV